MAIKELRRHAGTQFDPELVVLFCELFADAAPEPDASVVAMNAAMVPPIVQPLLVPKASRPRRADEGGRTGAAPVDVAASFEDEPPSPADGAPKRRRRAPARSATRGSPPADRAATSRQPAPRARAMPCRPPPSPLLYSPASSTPET